ncbi:MAG: ABC transporter permease, partial [Oligoflexia bacterium]|nr:ABC transporter permease [Oligoflexia bacterium]
IGLVQKPNDVFTQEISMHAKASGWFHIEDVSLSADKAYKNLTDGKIEALFIPTSQGLTYSNGRETPKAQLLLDATDILRARGAERYLLSVISSMTTQNQALTQPIGRFKSDSFKEKLSKRGGLLEVGRTSERDFDAENVLLKRPLIDVKTLYNPSLTSAFQMIPGVLCMIVCIFTIVLTSMSITKERERGTLEMLLVSPIKPFEIIAGKSIPYFLIGITNISIIIIVGMIIFNIPFRGSFLIYLLGASIFLVATLGVGILISTLAKSQQQAMMGSFIFLFPAMLLSGIMTPICNMPEFLQILANLNPLMHFVSLSRNIIIKGGSVLVFYKHFLILFLLATVLFSVATYRFRKTL